MLNGCEEIFGKLNHAVYWRKLIKVKLDFQVKLELQVNQHRQTGYF